MIQNQTEHSFIINKSRLGRKKNLATNSIPQAVKVNCFKIDFRKFMKQHDHVVMQTNAKQKQI